MARYVVVGEMFGVSIGVSFRVVCVAICVAGERIVRLIGNVAERVFGVVCVGSDGVIRVMAMVVVLSYAM